MQYLICSGIDNTMTIWLKLEERRNCVRRAAQDFFPPNFEVFFFCITFFLSVSLMVAKMQLKNQIFKERLIRISCWLKTGSSHLICMASVYCCERALSKTNIYCRFSPKFFFKVWLARKMISEKFRCTWTVLGYAYFRLIAPATHWVPENVRICVIKVDTEYRFQYWNPNLLKLKNKLLKVCLLLNKTYLFIPVIR